MTKLYHVLAEGVHPHNLWTRRPDGLFDLSGSVYAFPDAEVRLCKDTELTWRECKCWETPQGHRCPREGCKG
jgi:hypothetical protein